MVDRWVLDRDTLRRGAWPWSKQPSVQPTATSIRLVTTTQSQSFSSALLQPRSRDFRLLT